LYYVVGAEVLDVLGAFLEALLEVGRHLVPARNVLAVGKELGVALAVGLGVADAALVAARVRVLVVVVGRRGEERGSEAEE
jgi:hypothetical protein